MTKNVKITIAVVVVLILIGAAYWYFRKKKAAATPVSQEQLNVSNMADAGSNGQTSSVTMMPIGVSNTATVVNAAAVQTNSGPIDKFKLSAGF